MTKVAKDYVRFREIAKDNIPTKNQERTVSKSRWGIFVNEFIESEFEAAEIDIPEGRKINYERNTLYAYLKKHGYTDMLKVVQRQKRLFIINKTIDKTIYKPKKKASNIKKAVKKKTKPRRKLTPEETMIGSSYIGIYPGSESMEVDHV